ncbi:MAG: hypothetical protein QM811_13725 [Pirellulales bacterium]
MFWFCSAVSAETTPEDFGRRLFERTPVVTYASDEAWFRACCTAGGEPLESWSETRDALRRVVAAAGRELAVQGDVRSRGAALARWLHTEVFRRYDLDASSPGRTLADGRYNCVSASILYRYVARTLELDAVGYCRDEHCRIALRQNGNWWILETTCASCVGESAVTARIASDALGRDRLVDAAGMEALVWFNQAVDFARAGRVEAALKGNATALALDPRHGGAKSNLTANLNAAAIDALARRDATSAMAWLLLAERFNPPDETTRHNLDYLRRHAGASN